MIPWLGEKPGHPSGYSVCLVWVVRNAASCGDLETTLGAASFPRVRFFLKKYKQSQVSMQRTFVDLQGTSEAEAMETGQLSSHSNIPLGSVSGSVSSVPLIENVYHFLNFRLSMGCGGALLYGVLEWG